MANPNSPVVDRGIEPQVRWLHQQKMPHPADMGAWKLGRFAREVQAVLFRDRDYIGAYWNADKEWDSDTLEALGEIATRYGLRPPYGDGHLPSHPCTEGR